MDKNEIIKILGDWNFWDQDLNTGINRPYYLDKIKIFHESSHIIVITGARRSGKSFIMRQTAKALIKGGIRKNHILTFQFHILPLRPQHSVPRAYTDRYMRRIL